MAATDSATTEQQIFPISEISSYNTRWMIKARVTNKSQMRTFNKGGNAGQVFSVDLLDKQGGEIRASFFGQAAGQYFDKLQKNQCYTFSRGSAKVANRQFNSCNHRYELTFDKDALVAECADDTSIEQFRFAFVELRAVQAKTLPCRVDLCGVVVAFKPVASFTSKDGKEFVKREITVADDSGFSMDVAIWGDRAKQDDQKFANNPVIGLKGVMVKEWQTGRSGSLTQDGALVFQPNENAAKKVSQWWSQGGSAQSHTPLSVSGGGSGNVGRNARTATLGAVRQLQDAVPDQQEYLNVVARLAMVQTRKQGEVQPLTYLAVGEQKEGSNVMIHRKVDENGVDQAGLQTSGKIVPRMTARCKFMDAEDSVWLTTFHEPAQEVLGMTAEAVHALEQEAKQRGEGGREALDASIRQQYFRPLPFQLTLRAKPDNFQGETRLNVTVVDAKPAKPAEYGRRLLGEVRELLAAQPAGIKAGA